MLILRKAEEPPENFDAIVSKLFPLYYHDSFPDSELVILLMGLPTPQISQFDQKLSYLCCRSHYISRNFTKLSAVYEYLSNDFPKLVVQIMQNGQTYTLFNMKEKQKLGRLLIFILK